jgi:hypothetical protein
MRNDVTFLSDVAFPVKRILLEEKKSSPEKVQVG